VPALPPPTIAPVVPPAASPSFSYRPLPVQRAVKIRRTRFAATRLRRSRSRAAVREQGRLLNDGIPSICRGC
jgi:hypothetical protein